MKKYILVLAVLVLALPAISHAMHNGENSFGAGHGIVVPAYDSDGDGMGRGVGVGVPVVPCGYEPSIGRGEGLCVVVYIPDVSQEQEQQQE